MHYSIIFPIAALAGLSSASYSLVKDYGVGTEFFDKFDFFTGTDPTAGFVDYIDKSAATSAGLIKEVNGATYIGVDDTNVASSSGRKSVRLTSKESYTEGLFILDLDHMPGGQCGTWPAFWTTNTATWPDDGEIDIIEGVNAGTKNAMTLHTSDGCTINDSGFQGDFITGNCYIDASGQSSNEGCSIDSYSTASYGTGFNSKGGGVYAMEWTSSYIAVYWWTSANIPSDITSGSPDPSTWGTPPAKFEGSCDISEHFKDHNIIFDITFCGDWAGSVWSSGSCASKASTCEDYVQNNPTAFDATHWLVKSLKVYQN